MSEIRQHHPIIVFDGECGMCSRLVRWLIAKGIDRQVRFLPNQDPRFVDWLSEQNLSIQDSIYFIDQTKIETRGSAVQHILEYLPWKWRWFKAILWLSPNRINDFLYDLVAKHRKRIFGEVCELPTDTKRFL